MKLRIAAAIFLALTLCLSLVSSQTVATESDDFRDFGKFKIKYLVTHEGQQVLCTLYLNSTLVGQQVLSEEAPLYNFTVQSGRHKAKGMLQRTIRQTPQLSSLRGNFTVDGHVFNGALTTWHSARKQVSASQDYQLTPEIHIQTTLHNKAKNQVTISIYDASIALYSVTLIQASPSATTQNDLRLGTALIKKGAKFRLTIPTSLQQGSVTMSAQFKSGDNDLTLISATIASWAL